MLLAGREKLYKTVGCVVEKNVICSLFFETRRAETTFV